MKLKIYLLFFLFYQSITIIYPMGVVKPEQHCKGSGWFAAEKVDYGHYERMETVFLGPEDPATILNDPYRDFRSAPWWGGPCPKCESKKIIINGKEIQTPKWTFENGEKVICENSPDDVLSNRYNYPDIVDESVKQNCRDCTYDSTRDTLFCECWKSETKEWVRTHFPKYGWGQTPEGKEVKQRALSAFGASFDTIAHSIRNNPG